MIRPIDQFYIDQQEPVQSVFLALRAYIPSLHPDITEEWRYRLPFFYYKGKMLCYLWKDKKTQIPYIGIVKGNQIEHPALHQGDRKRMKVLYLNPNEDLPITTIETVLTEAIKLYK